VSYTTHHYKQRDFQHSKYLITRQIHLHNLVPYLHFQIAWYHHNSFQQLCIFQMHTTNLTNK
jgi:hypothetical protein